MTTGAAVGAGGVIVVASGVGAKVQVVSNRLISASMGAIALHIDMVPHPSVISAPRRRGLAVPLRFPQLSESTVTVQEHPSPYELTSRT